MSVVSKRLGETILSRGARGEALRLMPFQRCVELMRFYIVLPATRPATAGNAAYLAVVGPPMPLWVCAGPEDQSQRCRCTCGHTFGSRTGVKCSFKASSTSRSFKWRTESMARPCFHKAPWLLSLPALRELGVNTLEMPMASLRARSSASFTSERAVSTRSQPGFNDSAA